MWTVLAGGTVVLHVAYLWYQMFGGLFALRRLRWLPPHLACVTWGIVIVVMGWRCPLTMMEKWLRLQSGETPYTGSFLDHYVFGTLLPNGTQAWVYSLHLAFIALVYVVLVRQRLHSATPGSPPRTMASP